MNTPELDPRTNRRINCLSLKSLLFGLLLSTLAAMPLWSDFLPKQVDYSTVTKSIALTPGENQIGNVAITLEKRGKVLQVEKIHHQITNRVFGFRNFRNFLIVGTPFFSLLAFCLFFLWYDRQPKTRYLLTLKRYTWRVFFFVSIWFAYSLFIMECEAISGVLRYTLTYVATTVTIATTHYLYRYYQTTFRRKHSKLARLVSYLFEIRHKHYPRMACKALETREGYRKTRAHIEEYETQTFTVLDELVDHPQMEPPSSKAYKYKLILIGLVLSALAIAPLLYPFASTQVDYIKTSQTVPLKPGLNKIGDVSLSLSPQGTVLKAQRTEHHIIHKVFGFKNLKVFLENGSPFLTLLSFCLFFFWHEQQEKNHYVLALKWWAWGVFFLVALYFTYWTLMPGLDPISNGFYQIGTYAALAISLVALYYLYRHYGHKLRLFYARVMALLFHLFQVKKRHYPRMALKALGRTAHFQETCQQIREFDRRTTQVVDKVKRFIISPKLKREYEEYKRFKIDP